METYESVLLVKSEVFVFKIPPRTTNRGYRYFMIIQQGEYLIHQYGFYFLIQKAFYDRFDVCDTYDIILRYKQNGIFSI